VGHEDTNETTNWVNNWKIYNRNDLYSSLRERNRNKEDLPKRPKSYRSNDFYLLEEGLSIFRVTRTD